MSKIGESTEAYSQAGEGNLCLGTGPLLNQPRALARTKVLKWFGIKIKLPIDTVDLAASAGTCNLFTGLESQQEASSTLTQTSIRY